MLSTLTSVAIFGSTCNCPLCLCWLPLGCTIEDPMDDRALWLKKKVATYMSAYKFADLKKKKLAKYMSAYKIAELKYMFAKKFKKKKVATYADLKADLKKNVATYMSAYIAADKRANAKYMKLYMRKYRKQVPDRVKCSYIKKKKN